MIEPIKWLMVGLAGVLVPAGFFFSPTIGTLFTILFVGITALIFGSGL